MYEALAIVNSHPLTTDSLNDPNSLEPITPNHLITMKDTTALPPPGKFVKEDLYGQWNMPKRNIQVGDIVIDSDNTQPRSVWRLGRVSETLTDKDGLVRRLKILLGERNLNTRGECLSKRSLVERPVHKLVLLLEAS